MAKTTAKFDCMDPRRTHDSDQGEALRFRTAGGFVGGTKNYVQELIRRGDIGGEAQINLHTDCGAVKLVTEGLRDKSKVDESTYRSLVSPFLKFGPFLPVERIEDIALGIQAQIGLGWRNAQTGLLNHVNCTKAITSGYVEGQKTLLLTKPTTRKLEDVAKNIGLNPKSTYVITLVPANITQMAVDPFVAVKYLHIENVVVHAGNSDRERVINRFWGAYKRGDIVLPNANVERRD
jgi:hypothetical protein